MERNLSRLGSSSVAFCASQPYQRSFFREHRGIATLLSNLGVFRSLFPHTFFGRQLCPQDCPGRNSRRRRSPAVTRGDNVNISTSNLIFGVEFFSCFSFSSFFALGRSHLISFSGDLPDKLFLRFRLEPGEWNFKISRASRIYRYFRYRNSPKRARGRGSQLPVNPSRLARITPNITRNMRNTIYA